jgi:hypothetical protein
MNFPHWCLITTISCALVSLSGCTACEPPPEPVIDAGAGSGDGVLIRSGEEIAYAMNLEESYLRILVQKKSGPCSAFHDHAVEAKAVSLTFSLDEDAPENSTISAVAPAAALEPDSQESRETFEVTSGSTITASDRSTIYGSVQKEILGGEHPTLTFEVSGLPALEGTDLTATVVATIAGETSDIEMTYTGVFDGDVFTVEGTGTIDGSEHGMMHATLNKQCVRTDMTMALKLVLAPGVSDGPPEFDAGPAYEQSYFPYDGGCDDEIGYVAVSDVLLRRCAGCHTSDSSFPLVDYEDWRYDSITSPGRPLFERAGELLAATDGLAMPPLLDSTPLPEADLEKAFLWINKGAPKEQCSPGPVTPFVPVTQTACGTTNYDDHIKPMIDNNCVFCHDGVYHPLSLVSYDDGNQGAEGAPHDFYQPLTPWEVSVERIADKTMPPYGGWGDFFYSGDFDEDLALLQEWISLGYPESACAGADGGS